MQNNDLISRSALEAKAKTIYMEFDNVAVPTRVISIADLHLAPAIDAEPVRRGEWAHLGGDEWCCTSCGNVIYTEGSWEKPTKKYCHECGAKMDAEASE